MSDTSTIEIFINEAEQDLSIALLLKDPGIVEYEDELTPACALTSFQARCLAKSLVEMADRMEGQ